MGACCYLKLVTGLLLSVVLLVNPASAQGPLSSQPNIILIVLDDLGTEGLRAYGNKIYRTPNIDKLAEEGVRFSRFYANPQCVPTRASLMTGLYPPRTGWTANRKIIREDDCLDPAIGTFMQDLQIAGYATAIAGKRQVCDFDRIFDHPAQMGFDEWMLSLGGSHWGVSTWLNGARAPELETNDTYITDEHTNFAIGFIKRNVAGPFFFYFATKLPHKPFSKTPDTMQKTWPNGDPRYFRGMVKYADKMIGRILQALEEEGIENETIIIFLTDNGTESELPGGGKKSTSEAGIHVPLIIKWPGTTKPGAVRRNLADVTDLFPTILEMAGVDAPDDRDGYSLVPALTGKGEPTGREWIYAQRKDRFAIRKGRWKLRQKDQLFNLKRDRFEENPIKPKKDGRTSAKKRKELERILRLEGLGPEPASGT